MGHLKIIQSAIIFSVAIDDSLSTLLNWCSVAYIYPNFTIIRRLSETFMAIV